MRSYSSFIQDTQIVVWLSRFCEGHTVPQPSQIMARQAQSPGLLYSRLSPVAVPQSLAPSSKRTRPRLAINRWRATRLLGVAVPRISASQFTIVVRVPDPNKHRGQNPIVIPVTPGLFHHLKVMIGRYWGYDSQPPNHLKMSPSPSETILPIETLKRLKLAPPCLNKAKLAIYDGNFGGQASKFSSPQKVDDLIIMVNKKPKKITQAFVHSGVQSTSLLPAGNQTQQPGKSHMNKWINHIRSQRYPNLQGFPLAFPGISHFFG